MESVEIMFKGKKTKVNIEKLLYLLKNGIEFKNEYIMSVISGLVDKYEALESLNHNMLDMLKFSDKQTKEIDRLEAELKQLKEENEKAKSAERIKKLVSKIKEQKEITEFYKNQCEELRKTCNKLREENESIKNDKSELILAIKNTRDDIKMTADYLDSIVNAFHGNNKFDWDRFETTNIAVRCRTLDEAIDFIKSAKEHVEKWYDGNKIDYDNTLWDAYKEKTCYYFSKRAKGLLATSSEISKRANRKILEWSDYMVKHDE